MEVEACSEETINRVFDGLLNMYTPLRDSTCELWCAYAYNSDAAKIPLKIYLIQELAS